MVMENYEEFYRRCVYNVNTEAPCSAEPGQEGTPSAIQFHGRPVLLPKLSKEKRMEMAEQRQKAVKRESERRTRRTSSLLDHEQDVVNHAQVSVQHLLDAQVEQRAEPSPPDPQALSIRTTHPEDQLPGSFIHSSSTLRRKTLRLLNSRMDEMGKRREERREEEVDGKKSGSAGILPSHLGDTQRRSEGTAGVADLEPQCANRAEGGAESGNGLCFGEENDMCELECPLVVKTESSCSIDIESHGTPLTSPSLSASLMGSYVQLPSPQPSCSSLTRLRKPRLSAAGTILISLPVSELELNKTNPAHRESRLSENPSNGKAKSSAETLTGGPWNCSSSELNSKEPFPTPSSSASIPPRRSATLSHTPSPTQPGPAPHREKNRQSHSTPYQRSPPAPLNQSYDVENPSPSLLRPHVSSGSELFTEPVRRKLGLGRCGQPPTEDKKTLGHVYENLKVQGNKVGEVHQHIQNLEAPRQQVKEDRTHQLSPLLKTKERETQRLQQVTVSYHNSGHLMIIMCLTERSLCCLCFQLLPVEQQKAGCYLTAVGRGFLTRRLLQTEKIKHLRKTIQDSRELIRSFQNDVQPRRASFTPQDLSLQHRVGAQLRAALRNMHEIFFVWPLRRRLALLQQDRDLRNERRIKEMVKAKSSQDRPSLSSATQKSLDRRKQKPGKRIPPKPKDPSARVLQPAQRQNAPVISQKLRPVNGVQPVLILIPYFLQR
ncbi:hypothetical protein NFI96_018538 [Prochilodus magdalenae]|nr:hypothetical protein NFI96_018538 [Prochilodus magdalenae]